MRGSAGPLIHTSIRHGTARRTKTLKHLWHAALNTDDIDNGAELIFGHNVADRAFTVHFPFMHFPSAPIMVRFIMERVLGSIT